MGSTNPAEVPDTIEAFGRTLKRAPWPADLPAAWISERGDDNAEAVLKHRPWAVEAGRLERAWLAELVYAETMVVARGYGSSPDSAIAAALEEMRHLLRCAAVRQ